MKPFKIAIHQRKSSFSKRWIEYCQQNRIPFKIVDCHATNIIDTLLDVDVLLWHFNHTSFEDTLIAKHVLRAAELSGEKIFPASNIFWSFDNKIAQKYIPTVEFNQNQSCKPQEKSFRRGFRKANDGEPSNTETIVL